MIKDYPLTNLDEDNGYERKNPEENGSKKSKPVDYSYFLQEEKGTEEKTNEKSDTNSFNQFRHTINDPRRKGHMLLLIFLVIIVAIVFILKSFLF